MTQLAETILNPSHGSYNLASIAVDPDREVERLNAQVDLFWQKERELYSALGLPGAAAVLDCGCGPGHLLKKLREAFPGRKFEGIDTDSRLIELARQSAGADARDIQVKVGSITALEYPGDRFDFVIARLVLEHLPDPVPALREVFRVLKPGGTAVFIDNDFDFHERVFPETPALSDFYHAYRCARRAQNGNPCIGRELPGLLRRAGYEAIDLQLLPAHSELVGDSAFRRADGSGIPAQLVRQGFLPSASFDRLAAEWRSSLSDEMHAIFRMLFAASGRKPISANRQPSPTGTASANALNDFVQASPQVSRPGNSCDIRHWIRDRVAAEIGVEIAEADFDRPLLQFGMDSIAAAGLCDAAESSFGVRIPIANVLSGASITGLAETIESSGGSALQ